MALMLLVISSCAHKSGRWQNDVNGQRSNITHRTEVSSSREREDNLAVDVVIKEAIRTN